MSVNRRAVITAVAALLCGVLIAAPAWAERREVALQGYPLLSQKDASNYRDPTMAAALDTVPDRSRQVPVGDLACAATVYAIIERGRGNAGAMIDDFYADPRPLGGDGPGADKRPEYIGEETDVDRVAIETALGDGRPVILHGFGGPLAEHFVVAVGLRRGSGSAWSLVAIDPWPGKEQTAPGREIEIPFDADPLAHPLLPGVTFTKMRLMQGPWPAAAPVAETTPAATPQATGGDTVALKDGSVLVGTIAPTTLAFQTSFGEAQVPTDKIVEYKDGTLTLADGSTLKGTFAEPMLGTAKLDIATAAGALAVPLGEITAIRRAGIVVTPAAPAQQAPSLDGSLGLGQGILAGRVLNNFGLPLRDVEIAISGTKLKATTNSQGEYLVPYVPGVVEAVYHKMGYESQRRQFQISATADYPVQDVYLYEMLPSTTYVVVGAADYGPLTKCDMRLSWRKPNTSNSELHYFVSGLPTPIASVLDRFTFGNSTGKHLRLHRLDENGGYRRTAGYNHEESLIDTQLDSHDGFDLVTAVLQAGTYAFIEDNKIQLPDVAFGNVGLQGTCYLFEVFSDVKSASAAVRNRECYFKPTSHCVLASAIDTAVTVNDPARRALGLASVAKIQATADSFTKTSGTLSLAIIAAEGVEDITVRASTLLHIARMQTDLRDLRGANVTLRKAVAATNRIGDAENRVSMSIKVAGAFAEVGDVATASEIAQNLEKTTDRVRGLLRTAEGQKKFGDTAGTHATLTQAAQIALGMKVSEIPVLLLLMLAKDQLDAGDVPGAAASIARLRLVTLDDKKNAARVADLLAKFARAQFEVGHLTESRAALSQAIDFCRNIESTHNCDAALAAIVEVQASTGDFTAAIDTARTIEGAYIRTLALAKIARTQITAGHLSAAFDGLSRIEDPTWRARLMTEVGITLAKVGDSSQATAMLVRARETAVDSGDSNERNSVLGDIVGAQAEVGDVNGAFNTADRIKSPFFHSIALLKLARGQVKTGDVMAARSTLHKAADAAQQIEWPQERTSELVQIARSQNEVGDSAGVRATLSEAYQTAASYWKDPTVEDAPSEWDLLSKVARAQLEIGDKIAATNTISLSLIAVGGVGRRQWNAFALAEAAQLLAKIESH